MGKIEIDTEIVIARSIHTVEPNKSLGRLFWWTWTDDTANDKVYDGRHNNCEQKILRFYFPLHANRTNENHYSQSNRTNDSYIVHIIVPYFQMEFLCKSQKIEIGKSIFIEWLFLEHYAIAE